MFGSLLAPFLPYLLGVIAVGAVAGGLYIKYLLNSKAALQSKYDKLVDANNQTVAALRTFQLQEEQHEAEIKAANTRDVAATEQKQQDLAKADDLTSSDDHSGLSDADIAALKKIQGGN